MKSTKAKTPGLTERLKESGESFRAWARDETRLKVSAVEANGARVVFYATKTEMEAFQERLEALRAIRGGMDLSQSEMASLLRVGVGTLQGWEIGRRKIPESTMLLAEILHDYPEVRKNVSAEGKKAIKTKKAKPIVKLPAKKAVKKKGV